MEILVCQACDCGADERGVLDADDFVMYAFLLFEIFIEIMLHLRFEVMELVESCPFGHDADGAIRIAAFAGFDRRRAEVYRR